MSIKPYVHEHQQGLWVTLSPDGWRDYGLPSHLMDGWMDYGLPSHLMDVM